MLNKRVIEDTVDIPRSAGHQHSVVGGSSDQLPGECLTAAALTHHWRASAPWFLCCDFHQTPATPRLLHTASSQPARAANNHCWTNRSNRSSSATARALWTLTFAASTKERAGLLKQPQGTQGSFSDSSNRSPVTHPSVNDLMPVAPKESESFHSPTFE